MKDPTHSNQLALLEELVAEILELPEDRQPAAFDRLRSAHPDHEDLIRRWEEMVRAVEPAQRRETLLMAVRPSMQAEVPERIGHYEIIRVLGEGGMGTVYLAEQTEPVRRQVALKVIKLGMDTVAVLKRFSLERQALAVMSHDYIAKVFDAGTTGRGQPYFVMEHVEGIPLTQYCDRHQLSLKERIELFQKVCAGVQHAHQKGVIHRDLKPQNILVGNAQGTTIPKIIDFGLARATDQMTVQHSLFTERGVVIGTPEYMAPEQADPSETDIDTRTDIYSLGVILYEVLVGMLPVSREELQASEWTMMRAVLELEPLRPSMKLSSAGPASTEIAVMRRTTPAALRRELKNDLDWIVLKAMEKERDRRYSSVAELSSDLARYLRHEPLIAGPPSTAYRLRKLARRYRGQLIAAAVVMLTAVLGAIVAVLYAVEAGNQAEVARNERNVADQQRDRADEKAQEALDRKAEFDMLANVVYLETAKMEETELFPAWPDKLESMSRWLREQGDRLRAALPELRQTVDTLAERALPQSDVERQEDRIHHPLLGQLEELSAQWQAMQRAQAIREGRTQLQEMALPPELADRTAAELNDISWPLVEWSPTRRIWGRERYALAVAQAAFERALGRERASTADTLAWALFANGLDTEAVAMSERALDLAMESERDEYETYLNKLQETVEKWKGTEGQTARREVEERVAELSREVLERQTWTFEIDSEGFLFQTLKNLVGEVESFEETQRAGVERRVAWAERIGELTRDHPNARVSWAEARTAILRADGEAASELYRDPAIDLAPQTGLVPMGMNPVTKLWEFYHLRSAWNGRPDEDPGDLPIPVHRPDGSVEVTGETGIVFVLVPGGTFTMGAQRTDPRGGNFDEWAIELEAPVHSVTLAPFFLGRHEVTQGQWSRLAGGENPARTPAGGEAVPRMITLAHPVEYVTWHESSELLRQHGMMLPTEAQWEYACRARTDTPWAAGPRPEDLAGYGNVLDAYATEVMDNWPGAVYFRDGHATHAPAGSFRSNDWGLFDMHGNVWEWVRDWLELYENPVAEGDGLRVVYGEPRGQRIFRGGGYFYEARHARSARRAWDGPSFKGNVLGLRALREVLEPPATGGR